MDSTAKVSYVCHQTEVTQLTTLLLMMVELRASEATLTAPLPNHDPTSQDPDVIKVAAQPTASVRGTMSIDVPLWNLITKTVKLHRALNSQRPSLVGPCIGRPRSA